MRSVNNFHSIIPTGRAAIAIAALFWVTGCTYLGDLHDQDRLEAKKTAAQNALHEADDQHQTLLGQQADIQAQIAGMNSEMARDQDNIAEIDQKLRATQRTTAAERERYRDLAARSKALKEQIAGASAPSPDVSAQRTQIKLLQKQQQELEDQIARMKESLR